MKKEQASCKMVVAEQPEQGACDVNCCPTAAKSQEANGNSSEEMQVLQRGHLATLGGSEEASARYEGAQCASVSLQMLRM